MYNVDKASDAPAVKRSLDGIGWPKLPFQSNESTLIKWRNSVK
jgi:hypothetical protein